MFELIPQIFGNVSKKLKKRQTSDSTDHLYSVAAIVLLMLALTVSARQYFGSPIRCVIPHEWSRSWEDYAEGYCFTDGGYFVARDEMVRNLKPSEYHFGAPYYQWVPQILLIAAALLSLPSRIWQWQLGSESLIDYEHVIKEVLELRKLAGKEREERFELLIECLVNGLQLKLAKKTHRRILGAHFNDNSCLLSSYLTLTYAAVKLAYVVVLVTLIGFLRYAISPHFWMWWGAMFGLVESDGVVLFPTEIICDIYKRELSPLPFNLYAVQCLLMVNQWNEKIFTGLGLALIVMLVLSGLSLFKYLIEMLPCSRRRVVRQILKHYAHLDAESSFTVHGDVQISRSVAEFADKGLGSDGFLLLRFIEGVAGGEMAKQICEQLYLAFQPNEWDD